MPLIFTKNKDMTEHQLRHPLKLIKTLDIKIFYPSMITLSAMEIVVSR